MMISLIHNNSNLDFNDANTLLIYTLFYQFYAKDVKLKCELPIPEGR